MGIVDSLYGVAWAIRPEALAALCEIVERKDVDPHAVAAAMHFNQRARDAAVQAVERRAGTPLPGTQESTRRGRVAVVPIVGPIVRYASLFSGASGAASVEALAQDFTTALEDPMTKAILLAVDSPGGETAGIAELADMIHRARAAKPVWAYVSDLGASAGYWLASGAEQIVVAETAALGSIGVVAIVKDPARHANDEIEFVSSVSPRKRADPTTEDGQAQLQSLVDDLGAIFVQAVARNRGVSAETVVSDFGAGGLLIGRKAVAAGLADRTGSFEATLDDLEAAIDMEGPPAGRGGSIVRDGPTDLTATEPEPVPAPSHQREGWMSAATLRTRFGRFIASLDPPDAEALADALDGVAPPPQSVPVNGASVASGGLTTTTNLVIAPPEPPPPAPPPTEEPPMAEMPANVVVTATTVGDGDIPSHVANRLAHLEAENARMHAERIQERARAFAEAQVRDFRATAAQVDVITTLFAALAEDDERFRAIVRADGSRVLRTTLLENFFASQPDRSVLGQEMITAAGGQVIFDRATARKRSADDEPTDERLAELLAHTNVGRQVLEASVFGANGHAKKGG